MNNININYCEKPLPSNLLLQATDTPKIYWEINILSVQWQFYVVTNQAIIKPQIYISSLGLIFVGIEQGIFVLDIKQKILIDQVRDASYFVIFQPYGLQTLAIDEDQFFLFASDGYLKWRTYFPDIIDDFFIEYTSLHLIDVTGKKYSVDIKSGKFIKN